MEDFNRVTDQNKQTDLWQAKVFGQIYDTNFVGITGWINEGTIQSSDKIRCGNMGWIEAGKIPALLPFFNAKGNGFSTGNVKINHIRFSGDDQMNGSTDSDPALNVSKSHLEIKNSGSRLFALNPERNFESTIHFSADVLKGENKLIGILFVIATILLISVLGPYLYS